MPAPPRTSTPSPRWAAIVAAACAALACTALACVRLMDAPDFICSSNSGCPSGQKCSYGSCVAADHCLSYTDCGLDQTCIGTRCAPAVCTSASSAVCGDYACGPDRMCLPYCTRNSDCRAGLLCVSGGCQAPRANGSTCTAPGQCASGWCCASIGGSNVCAATCDPVDAGAADARDASTSDAPTSDATTSGALGSACSIDSECQSRHCCATASVPNRTCRSDCPALTGDHCVAVPTENCSESGAYCDGLTNFPEDGYCSRGCGAGCGYNSSGRANVCIRLTSGSSPASACKPGCELQADCRAIHPDLTCWMGFSGKKACDFSTDTWSPTE